MFPFLGKAPRRDKNLVRYNFVDTHSKFQRNILGLILRLQGYIINKHIYNQKGYLAIGIPINKTNNLVSDGFSIYVRAQQVYHGAINYKSIYNYIRRKK